MNNIRALIKIGLVTLFNLNTLNSNTLESYNPHFSTLTEDRPIIEFIQHNYFKKYYLFYENKRLDIYNLA